MRPAWTTGLALAVGGVVLLFVGSWLDLRVTGSLLLGLGLGGALAAAPGGVTAGARVGAAATGLAAAWIGYLLRALELPDSTGGAAVALVVVIAICAVPAGFLGDRLPLWASLIGAGAFVGLYETAYSAAPAEMATTSLTALSNAVLVLGAGFLLGSLVQPRPARPVAAPAADQPTMETI